MAAVKRALASWARELISSLREAWLRCTSTVLIVTKSVCAISLLLIPSAILSLLAAPQNSRVDPVPQSPPAGYRMWKAWTAFVHVG